MQEKLENKKDFYEICEKYNLAYPDTVIIEGKSDKDIKKVEDKLSYPLALKANDSINYYNTYFEDKRKAYKIYNKDELIKTLDKIYKAGYCGEMIVQDFIPGDSSNMVVLNAYVDSKSKVRMMSLGKCLLDEVLPLNIGNYNALATFGNDKIYKQYKKFLEEISYKGFANFDLKYDERDGKYKVFEINIRQGRSSFYMNSTSNNFLKYIVDDLIFKRYEECYFEHERGLWLYVDPLVLKKYVNKKDKELALKLLKKGMYLQYGMIRIKILKGIYIIWEEEFLPLSTILNTLIKTYR